MKKVLSRIYLIFLMIVLFSCKTVFAAEELICIYNNANSGDSNKEPIMMTQDKDGSLSFRFHKTTNGIGNYHEPDSPGWSLTSFKTIYYNDDNSELSVGNFNSCPQSVNTDFKWFVGAVIYLYDDANGGNHSLYKELHNSLDENNYKPQSGLCANSLPKGAKSSWLNQCTYNYVTIYFNESKWYQVCSQPNIYLTMDTTFNNYYKMYKSLGGKCPQLKATKTDNFDENGQMFTQVTYQLTRHDGDLVSEKINDPNPPESEYDSEINTDLPEIAECTVLLGDPGTTGSPAFYLLKAFHVIKYVALVLMIVLSVMDFTSATAKQDKEAMAKILKKIMMRFILCIIIFLLPYFINLLLKYLVERQTDLCGIK